MKGWARRVKRVLNAQYPDAEKVVLVVYNLNTHVISSLYETFPSEEALRLIKRMEILARPNMAVD
jgi:hypothetical protein